MRADLADPGWAESDARSGYDAAITANALHWLDEPTLARVYADLASLVRPGGSSATPIRCRRRPWNG